MPRPEKILAIQFKSLGDAVLMLPALQALREKFPGAELHAFVSEAAAPLLEHAPFLTRVWKIPRVRGRANFKKNWPVIRALRAEKFDRSVDFGGNDRGAILSLVCGARERLGLKSSNGFFGRRFCFNRRVARPPQGRPESLRAFAVLAGWEIPPPLKVKTIKIFTDPALENFGTEILPAGTIVCHMGAARANRRWPVARWADFYKLAVNAGWQIIFTPGNNPNEHAMIADLKKISGDIAVLPPLPLPQFLAALKNARALVTGDTGPMHLAAGLGVPVVALFGPSSPAQWLPATENCQILIGDPCACAITWHDCRSVNSCMNAIAPEKVFAAVKNILAARRS